MEVEAKVSCVFSHENVSKRTENIAKHQRYQSQSTDTKWDTPGCYLSLQMKNQTNNREKPHHTVIQERITSPTVGRVLAGIAKCIYLPHELVYILTSPVT